MEPFSLLAKVGTDIWRKPPAKDVYNAPTQASSECPSAIPLSSFASARISFKSAWSEQYDQGGLLITLHHNTEDVKRKWIKSGVEFYNGKPLVSTVGCDAWADWSVWPVEPSETEWTIEVRREGDKNGKSLWVYKIDKGDVRRPLREVCWFFAEEESWNIKVEAYAAREHGTDPLKVDFWDFHVEQRS